jgi:hypothetical protein
MWERNMEFKGMLAQAWSDQPRVTILDGLQKKLEALSVSLSGWEWQSFGSVNRELKGLTTRLDRLRSDPARTSPSYQELNVVDRILELNYREEIMWRQRSRIAWLTKGDRNIHFFHLRANQRRKRNKISRLLKGDGSFTEDEDEMADPTT